VLALVIISGRKNTVLEQQGDTVGNLVRDVSEQLHKHFVLILGIIVDAKVMRKKKCFRHGNCGMMEGYMSL
jgi:hypothetical protein